MLKLDHYYAYPVEKVKVHGKSGKWEITLRGGAVIRNHDKTMEAPSKDIVGSSLLTVIFSQTETTLMFGHSGPQGSTTVGSATLNPTEYSITDPNRPDEGEVYPQVPEELVDVLPPDPSPLRIAPENDAVSAEEPSPPSEGK